MTDTTMTCERLETLLPDYLDGALGELDRLAVERHLAGCPDCGPLVADVRGIVAEAQALPALRPSRDLWAGIEARIATPVVAIGPSALGPRPSAAAPPRFVSRRWLAAAAVLLVATTAGITYEVTRRMQGTVQQIADAPTQPFGPAPVDPDAVPLPSAASQDPAESREPRAESRERAENEKGSDAPSGAESGVRRTPRTAPQAPRTAPETRLVSDPSPDATGAIERPYAREIDALAQMVEKRRGELDPATVAVLEHSLKVIDQAIAQSKEALRRDPASGFLQEELNHALDKKVTLLRNFARLPART